MSARLGYLALALWVELSVAQSKPVTAWVFDNYFEGQTPSSITLDITPVVSVAAGGSVTITASPAGWPFPDGSQTVSTDHTLTTCTYTAETSGPTTTMTVTPVACALAAGGKRTLSFPGPFSPNPLAVETHTLSTVTSTDTAPDLADIPIVQSSPSSPTTVFTFSSLKPLEQLTAFSLLFSSPNTLGESKEIIINSGISEWPFKEATGSAKAAQVGCEDMSWTKDSAPNSVAITLPSTCTLAANTLVVISVSEGLGSNPPVGTYEIATTTTSDAIPAKFAVEIADDLPSPTPTPASPSPSPSTASPASSSAAVAGIMLAISTILS